MATYFWAAGDGSWDQVNDWTPTGIPGGADIAYIDQGGAAYTVTTDGASVELLYVEDASATVEVNTTLTASVIELNAGAVTVDSAGYLVVGNLQLSGGSLSVAGELGGSTVTLSGGALSIQGGALLYNDAFVGAVTLNASGQAPIKVAQNLTLSNAAGNGPGALNLSNNEQLDFLGVQTFDDATVNLGDTTAGTSGYLAETVNSGGSLAALTLGDGLVVNSNGVSDEIFDADGHASSITNFGALHQLNASGSLYLGLYSGTFTNAGLVDSYSGGKVTFGGAHVRNAGVINVGGGSRLFSYADAFLNTVSGRLSIGAGSTWAISGFQSSTPSVKSQGQIALAGGVLSSSASGLVFTNAATGEISGYGAISLSALDNEGVIEATGGTVNLEAQITGAGALKGDRGAVFSLSANATQATLTQAAGSALTIGSGDTLTLTGTSQAAGVVNGGGTLALAGTSQFYLGAGATVATAKGVSNAGFMQLGVGNIAAPVSAKVDRIDNSGGWVQVLGSTTSQALLSIGSAAGFGVAGEILGQVTLLGDSAISFASGAITTNDGVLALEAPDAYLELAGAAGSESALTSLSRNNGIFDLFNGATLATTKTFVNAGAVHVGDTLNSSGSGLSVGALYNSELISVGEGNQSSVSSLTATSLNNTGEIEVNGREAERSVFEIGGTVVNTRMIGLAAVSAEIAGAVGGQGKFSLNSGTTLTFDGAVASTQTVFFQGPATVTAKSAANFQASLSGFATQDVIDEASIAFAGAHFAFAENSAGTAGTLTLTSGAASAHIHLLGDYTQADFSLAADSGTGTLVKFV